MDQNLIEAAHTINMFCRLNMQIKFSATFAHTEMHVMVFIKKSKTPPTPAMISEFFRVSRPFITRTINSLEQDGYIEKIPSQTDSRSYHLSLTDKGEKLLADEFNRVFAVIENLKEKMGEQNFSQLTEYLKIANKILAQEKSYIKERFEEHHSFDGHHPFHRHPPFERTDI